MRTRLSSPSNLNLLCKGISASHGVTAGKVVLDSEVARSKAERSEPLNTSPSRYIYGRYYRNGYVQWNSYKSGRKNISCSGSCKTNG